MENSELREMSNDQLHATMAETKKLLFRLNIQSQTERLDVPTELRRNRRLIARINTILREREIAESKKDAAAPAAN